MQLLPTSFAVSNEGTASFISRARQVRLNMENEFDILSESIYQ